MEERVLYVEFRNGSPWEMVTLRKEDRHENTDWWDIECNRRADRFMRHCSGAGGLPAAYDATYYAAKDLVVEEEGECQRIEMPEGWTEERLLDMPESDMIYCGVCDDWFEEEEICEHIWWCDECGWWRTPSDPCNHSRLITPNEDEDAVG